MCRQTRFEPLASGVRAPHLVGLLGRRGSLCNINHCERRAKASLEGGNWKPTELFSKGISRQRPHKTLRIYGVLPSVVLLDQQASTRPRRRCLKEQQHLRSHRQERCRFRGPHDSDRAISWQRFGPRPLQERQFANAYPLDRVVDRESADRAVRRETVVHHLALGYDLSAGRCFLERGWRCRWSVPHWDRCPRGHIRAGSLQVVNPLGSPAQTRFELSRVLTRFDVGRLSRLSLRVGQLLCLLLAGRSRRGLTARGTCNVIALVARRPPRPDLEVQPARWPRQRHHAVRHLLTCCRPRRDGLDFEPDRCGRVARAQRALAVPAGARRVRVTARRRTTCPVTAVTTASSGPAISGRDSGGSCSGPMI